MVKLWTSGRNWMKLWWLRLTRAGPQVKRGGVSRAGFVVNRYKINLQIVQNCDLPIQALAHCLTRNLAFTLAPQGETN